MRHKAYPGLISPLHLSIRRFQQEVIHTGKGLTINISELARSPLLLPLLSLSFISLLHWANMHFMIEIHPF